MSQERTLSQLPRNLRLCLHPAQGAFEGCWRAEGVGTEPGSSRIPENAGKCGTNNSVLVIYDDVGDPLVTGAKELHDHGLTMRQAYDLLEAAGYRNEPCFVPHSNDGGEFVEMMRRAHLQPELVSV